MRLTETQKERFRRDGFLLFPGLVGAAEVAAMRREIGRLARLDDECVVRETADGAVRTVFRVHEADGATASPPFAAFARTPRALGLARQVLEDDALYLHHTKINAKCAVEGTVWPWHQDFGSWRLDGIARPDMATLTVMLDDADAFSGCLWFLPGSHRAGRVPPRWDRSTPYGFWALPPQTVRDACAAASPVAVTGKPGDAALFHCNLFHASGHNLSPRDRWQAYFCYNAVANRPADIDEPRPDYVRSRNWAPLALVDDGAPPGAA